MSLKTEGQSCARCHAYLFEEDDIVYCPVCGAPHHRDCYAALGHCALEELHGTDRQYDRVKAEEEKKAAAEPEKPHTGEHAEGMITCQMCHTPYEFTRNACPKCGAPNVARAGGSFVNFDFLGGVPADFDIGEGVTAEESKRLVAVNTQRYIPKFTMLTKKKKTSWNWAAFLFPCGWMFSRKMYKSGIIAGLMTVMSTLLMLPFSNAVYHNIGTSSEPQTYMQLGDSILQNIDKIGIAVIIAAAVGSVLRLLVRIFSAAYADWLYKSYVVSTVKKLRAESEDMDYDYRRKGGVNMLMFFVGTIAVQYLPAIIAVFII